MHQEEWQTQQQQNAIPFQKRFNFGTAIVRFKPIEIGSFQKYKKNIK